MMLSPEIPRRHRTSRIAVASAREVLTKRTHLPGGAPRLLWTLNVGSPEIIMMRVSEKWYLYESNGTRPLVGL